MWVRATKHTHTYTHTHTSQRYMCVCVCVCMCIHIHTHTHISETGISVGEGDEMDVAKLVEMLETRLSSGEEECCVCLDAIEPASAVITKCAHIFCSPCLQVCVSASASASPPTLRCIPAPGSLGMVCVDGVGSSATVPILLVLLRACVHTCP